MTIQIAPETVSRLKNLGIKGETYDHLLQRLLNERGPPGGMIA
jgi:hypothetical protein